LDKKQTLNSVIYVKVEVSRLESASSRIYLFVNCSYSCL